MKTAVISSDHSTNHLTGDGHPEQPKRVVVITEKLKKHKNLIYRAGIWKPRTRPNSFEGVGEKGLKILQLAKKEIFLFPSYQVNF